MAAKYVIFDMDGLMFDTENLFIRSFQEGVAPALGRDFKEEDLKKLIGLNSRATEALFPALFGTEPGVKECFQIAHRWLDDYMEKEGIPMKPGLTELLCALRETGAKLALATSTNRLRAESYLRKANVSAYFDVLVAGDMITHSKPDPEIFLIAAEKLGCKKPGEAFVLEDSGNGVLAGLAGGFKTVLVPDIAILPEGIEKRCAAVFSSLKEAIPYLCGTGGR